MRFSPDESEAIVGVYPSQAAHYGVKRDPN
jgi:hypothetical protein